MLYNEEKLSLERIYQVGDLVGHIFKSDVEDRERIEQLAELLHKDLAVMSESDYQSLNRYEVLELVVRLLRILYKKEEGISELNRLLKEVRLEQRVSSK